MVRELLNTINKAGMYIQQAETAEHETSKVFWMNLYEREMKKITQIRGILND